MRNIAIADRSEWTIERDAAAVPDPKRPRRLRDSRPTLRMVGPSRPRSDPLVVTIAAGPTTCTSPAATWRPARTSCRGDGPDRRLHRRPGLGRRRSPALASVTADGSGRFRMKLAIPKTAKGGSHTLTLAGADGAVVTTAKVSVHVATAAPDADADAEALTATPTGDSTPTPKPTAPDRDPRSDPKPTRRPTATPAATPAPTATPTRRRRPRPRRRRHPFRPPSPRRRQPRPRRRPRSRPRRPPRRRRPRRRPPRAHAGADRDPATPTPTPPSGGSSGKTAASRKTCSPESPRCRCPVGVDEHAIPR